MLLVHAYSLWEVNHGVDDQDGMLEERVVFQDLSLLRILQLPEFLLNVLNYFFAHPNGQTYTPLLTQASLALIKRFLKAGLRASILA